MTGTWWWGIPVCRCCSAVIRSSKMIDELSPVTVTVTVYATCRPAAACFVSLKLQNCDSDYGEKRRESEGEAVVLCNLVLLLRC